MIIICYFILKHSTGALPNNSEIDTPINYADYYFLEAMYRLKQLKKIIPVTEYKENSRDPKGVYCWSKSRNISHVNGYQPWD